MATRLTERRADHFTKRRRPELERLQREFEPYTKDSVGFGYLDQRVQRYIERILAARE